MDNNSFKIKYLIPSLFLISHLSKFPKGRLIYCPPYTLLSSFYKKFQNCLIDIGAQNCHESSEYGAHTGFVNPKMIKNIGANYVIIGHSENRNKGETDKIINQKIKSAINAKLKVIFCIGETLTEKRSGKTKSVLSKQIKYGLDKIKPRNSKIKFIKCDIVEDKELKKVIKKIYSKHKTINIFLIIYKFLHFI